MNAKNFILAALAIGATLAMGAAAGLATPQVAPRVPAVTQPGVQATVTRLRAEAVRAAARRAATEARTRDGKEPADSPEQPATPLGTR